ncbi:7511_t:CDS:2 [Paraglomus occultum]|uniref:7511_t:CDS:1 n=1 Tax=Paraglomus occultum TaxID=144539 RepID=A0A9N8ZIE7_9GLOM|nr:7511_t:CDS:2 [Paraglomus occultum]
MRALEIQSHNNLLNERGASERLQLLSRKDAVSLIERIARGVIESSRIPAGEIMGWNNHQGKLRYCYPKPVLLHHKTYYNAQHEQSELLLA